MEKKTLFGVRLSGIMQIIIGMIYEIFFIYGVSTVGLAVGVNIYRGMPLRFLAMASLYLLLICSGVGLLKTRNWARLTSIFISPALMGLVLGKTLLLVFWVSPLFKPITLTSLQVNILLIAVPLISIAIIYILHIFYLNHPKVREQFKQS
ncbi:MAG: hypothetical protein Q8O13_08035 [Candidatus Omnitrophota bacterium]|nr:hypothetical protein [Candidatus Omnitrophota bacterium]